MPGDVKDGALGAEASLISIAKVVVATGDPAPKTVLAGRNLSKPFAQAVSTEIAKRTTPAVVA